MGGSELAGLIIGQLIGAILGGLIGGLIAAILLRAAAQWVAKLDVPFGRAYWTVFLAFIVNFLLGYVLGFVVAFSGGSSEALTVLQVLLLPVGFLIQSGIISARLEVSFGKGCLISLVMTALVLGLALVIGVIFALVMAATGSW